MMWPGASDAALMLTMCALQMFVLLLLLLLWRDDTFGGLRIMTDSVGRESGAFYECRQNQLDGSWHRC